MGRGFRRTERGPGSHLRAAGESLKVAVQRPAGLALSGMKAQQGQRGVDPGARIFLPNDRVESGTPGGL